MKLTKREQFLLLGALIIVIGVIFIKYGYFPIKDDIKALKRQSEELSLQINEAEQKQALVETLQAQLTKLQEDNNVIYEDVMKTWDEPELLVYIEEILGDSGVGELVENYGVTAGEGYINGDINLNITATYEKLMTILKKFEDGKYFNTIEAINVEENDNVIENAGIKTLKMKLILRFYALDLLKEYTEDYPFMQGRYSKTNIFK